MITADQLVAHLLGDYVFQNSWMANSKNKAHLPAAVHAIVYATVFFLFLWFTTGSRLSFMAVLIISSTHFVIDRWRLARFVNWGIDCIAPPTMVYWQCSCCAKIERSSTYTEISCRRCYKGHMVRKTGACLPWRYSKRTGYSIYTPDHIADWLLIIVDNTMHIVINGLAVYYYG